MKKLLFTLLTILSVTAIAAQSDSTMNQYDTIKTKKYVIIRNNYTNQQDTIKKKSINTSHSSDNVIDISYSNAENTNKNGNIKTKWFVFDLGFANFNDKTNYAVAQSGQYFQDFGKGEVNASTMNLINSKSSNVNIWLFMQKINIAKHKLNLKWALGSEMYNFRFENNLSYRSNDYCYIFKDSVNFSKNKLFANYLTVPIMINYRANPENESSFTISAGVSAGYLINARNKQISNERGKQKFNSNFDLETFRLALVGEIGLGPIQVYGSYSLTNLYKDKTGLEQYPFAFGVRFSKW